MLKSPFNFLSSVEAETPTGVWGWAKRLIETLQKWRLTDLIDQSLIGNEGKFIRVKDDASGYEHAGGTKFVNATVSYAEESSNGDVVIVGVGPISVALPTAIGNAATFFIRAVSDAVTIVPNGTETINASSPLVVAVGTSVILRSDNSNWWTF